MSCPKHLSELGKCNTGPLKPVMSRMCGLRQGGCVASETIFSVLYLGNSISALYELKRFKIDRNVINIYIYKS